MDESEALKETLLKCGADMVGYADASLYYAEYTTAVIIGVSIEHPSGYAQSLSLRNKRLDYLGGIARQWLYEKRHGFSGALFSQEEEGTRIPTRAFALSCGMGWLGKNGLVVTEAFGPRMDFTTVLTTLPFSSEEGNFEHGCRDCRLCVEACPAGVFGSGEGRCSLCYRCVLACPMGGDSGGTATSRTSVGGIYEGKYFVE